jgi:predicted nucleotide-binding protein
MSIPDVSGFWTGKIFGTNHGGITLDLKQDGANVTGVAKMHEPALGQYEYSVTGVVGDNVSFRLQPTRSNGLNLGTVKSVCQIESDGTLSGRWTSDIGTDGAFTAKRFETKELQSQLPEVNSVFLVHGHDEGAKHSVARFIEKLGVEPVILQEQINRGMTVIEKFEDFASRAGFAVVMMTPDDVAYPIGKEEDKGHRPRQNVVLELGYFVAKLGREKVLVLTKGNVELPSDLFGLVYEAMEQSDGWKLRLAKELKAAGFSIDLNQAI